MPSWKRVIVSGSDAALNSLNVTTAFTASGLNYPTSDGTANQAIVTDGAGNLTFGSPVSTNTTITIKNVSGGTIQKGTPCYITGSGTSGNVAGVWPADASNPLRMPAGVIAGETLTAGSEGIGLINGFISGVDTSAFAAGDSVYVAVGGGYTNIRPTGSAVLVQKLGNVEKSHPSNGSGVINGPGYYNDLPNVQQGYTWVGNSNGVAIAIATSSIQNVISSSFASTSSHTLAISGTDNYIPKFNGSSALENSVMYDDGTNIGIGTTIPGYKLDVTGLINATTTPGSYGTIIRVRDTVTSGVESFGGIHFTSSPGTDYTIGKWTTAAGAGLLQVRDQSGNQFMTINSVGNVGIGTTSPANKLSVSLGAFSNGSTVASILNTNSTQKSHVAYDTFLIQQDDAPTLRLYETGENLSTTISSDGGLTSFATTGEMGLFVAGSSTSPGWQGLNGIQAIRIKSNGNVGIGTTNPGRKFVVTGAANDEWIATFTNTGTNPYGVYIDTSANASSVFSFATYTNAGTGFFILNNGNVGIGTTNPGAKLQVNGDAYLLGTEYIFQTVNSSTGYLYFDHSGTQVWKQGIFSDNTSTFSIGNGGGFTRIFNITNAGNVGIGTTSPSQKLEVAGNIFANAGNGEGFLLNGSSIVRQNGSELAFNVNSAERMRITSTGNMGIGTTNPSYALDVSGSIRSNQQILAGSSITTSSESTLILGPAPAGGSGEGGQIALQPGSGYTSGSFLDNYQNKLRILRGTAGNTDAEIAAFNLHTKQLTLPAYNSTTAFTGTVAGILAFDSSGNILTTTASAGGGGGSGTVNSGTAGYLAYYPSTGTTVDDTSGVYWDAGNSRLAVGNSSPSYKVDVTGDIRATGAIYANANGAMYFQGGDDVALHDINVANTLGVYGQQDSTLGSIKLGSGGGVISGYNGNIGIGTTSPVSIGTGITTLDIQGSSAGGVAFGPSGIKNYIYGASTMYIEANTTAVFTTSGSEKMRITSGGNVGIGTTNPIGKLNINGGTGDGSSFDAIQTFTRTSSTGNVEAAKIVLDDFDTNYGNLVFKVKTTASSAESDSYYTDAITIKGSNAYVGIGTSNPSYKLHVVGNVYGTTTAQFGSGYIDGTQSGWAIFGSNSLSNGIKIVLDGDVSRNDIVVATNGNIGIGTSSPGAKLDIVGTNSTLALSFSNTVPNNPLFINTYGGWSGIGMDQTTAGLRLVGDYSSGTNPLVDIGYYSSATVGHANWVNRFRVLNNGNVGIGITNPGGKLDIVSTTNSNALFIREDTDNSITHNLWIDSSDNGQFWMYADGQDTKVVLSTSGVSYLNGGNVGIGTASPVSLLHVYGSGNTFTRYTNTSNTGHFVDVGAYSNGESFVYSYGAYPLLFGTNGSTRMTISSGGNVGIGTTSPSNALELAADKTLRIDGSSASNDNYGLSIGGYGFFRIDAPGVTGGRFIVNNAGNVGIGSSSPGRKLDVNGKAIFYNAGVSGTPYWNNNSVEIQSSGGGTVALEFHRAGYSSATIFSDDGAIGFNTDSGTERMRILGTSGNVGIGITNPSQKLHVAGNLRVTGAIYDSNNAAGSSGQVLSSTGTGTDWVSLSEITGVDGTGTANYVTKWQDADTVTNSVMYDNGTNISIGTTSPYSGTGVRSITVNATSYPTFALKVNDTFVGGVFGYSDHVDLYSEGYLNFETGGAEKMRITIAGNVGIGITNPSAKLYINNNGGTSAGFYADIGNPNFCTTLFEHTGANTPVPFRLKKSGYSGAALNYGLLYLHMNDNTNGNGSNLYFTLNNAAGDEHEYGGVGAVIRSNTNGSEQGDLFFMTSDNGTPRSEKMRIISNGNVGIGTTNPTSKLYVEGGSANWSVTNPGTTVGTIHLDPGTTSDNYGNAITFGASDSSAGATAQAGIYVRSDGTYGTKMYFGTTNSYVDGSYMRMIIDESGNIGIGTTSPSAKLHVIADTSSDDTVAIIQGTGALGSGLHLQASGTSGRTWRLLSTGTSSSPGAGALGFYDSTAGSYRFVINTSGNVGIGTTSPNGKMTIIGNTLDIRNSSGGYGTGYGLEFSTNAAIPRIDLIDNGVYTGQVKSTTGEFILNNSSNNALTLGTNNTERMRIAAGGNVLIGTTSDAGYKLRVNGSSYFDAPILCYTGNGYITALTNDGVGSNNGFGYSFLINNNGHEIGRLTGIYETSGGGGSGGLGFWTRGSGTLSTKMILNSGGTLTLNSYGSGTKTGTVAYNLAVDSSGNVIETAGGVVDGSGTANYIPKWQDANTLTNSVIYDDGTNVSIGTTNPGGYKVRVNGTSLFENEQVISYTNSIQTMYGGTGYSLFRMYGNNNGVEMQIDAHSHNSAAATIGTYSNSDVFIKTNNSNRMVIKASGDVGIGTTNPGAKLEVVGSFRATTKSFIIDHPTKEGKKLQYGVLEGPEHSVYVRGKLTGTRRIELPDYWHALVDEDSITVNLTAIGRGQQLWVEEITDTYIMVGSDSGIVNCFYTVFAERKDVDKLITEFDKE